MLRLRWAIAIALFVIGVSTLGYIWIEEAPWLDALYMTVITITTVGYGEVFPLSTAGRIWTMLVILMGWGSIAIVMTQIFSRILSVELWQRQRTLFRWRKMRNHIIVVGYGRIGREVARYLRRQGEQVLILAVDERNAQRARNDDFTVLQGNPTEDRVLKNAYIDTARALVAAMDDEAENVFVVIAARSLNPNLYIVSLASDKRSRELLLKAGANRAILAYEFVGQLVANLLLKPHVLDLFSMSNYLIEEVVITDNHPFAGLQIKDLMAKYGPRLYILGIKKPGQEIQFIPPPETTIEVGDVVLMAGERKLLTQLRI